MITQQVANYVIKKAKGLAQTPKSGSTKTEEILKKYFYTRDRRPMYDVLTSDEDIVQAFEWRAAHLIKHLKKGAVRRSLH
jgi:acyl-CoA oxidase